MPVVAYTSIETNTPRTAKIQQSAKGMKSSETATANSFTRKYHVMSDDGNAMTHREVEQVLRAYTASTDSGLFRTRMTTDEKTPFVFVGTIKWEAREFDITGSSGGERPSEKFSVSTEGTTVETTYALEVVGEYEAGDPPTNIINTPNSQVKGTLINPDEDGQPESVTVEVPGFDFEIKYPWAKGTIDFEYVTSMNSVSKKTNSAPWRGFEAGEVFFRGIQFANDPSSDYDVVTYKFRAEPNRTVELVNGNFNIPKIGHQYTSLKYTPDEDGGVQVQQPKRAFVYRMYESFNFSILGIPTTIE